MKRVVPHIITAVLVASLLGAGCAPVAAQDEDAVETTEDWCAEHRVPESMCTICNPSLRDAFIAADDFCTEHELPESVCPFCGNGAEAPGAVLTPAIRSLAGVETTVAWAGEPRVFSRLGVVEASPLDATVVASPTAGIVVRLRVQLGDRVAIDQPVAEIASPEARHLRSELAVARERLARAERLREGIAVRVSAGLEPQSALVDAEAELHVARAELGAAQSASSALDAGATGVVELRAPAAGVVLEVEVAPGGGVDAGAPILTILADGPRLVRFDVPVEDAHSLPAGASVQFAPAGGAPFTASIARVAPTADAESGLRALWADLAEPIAVGTPGRVLVDTAQCSAVPTTSIVVSEGGWEVLIVEHGEAAVRAVRIVAHRGAITCVSGVEPGEVVVSQGANALAAWLDPSRIADGCVDH